MRVVSSSQSQVYYLFSDPLGSLHLTVDPNGALHAGRRYYPFGAPRAVSPGSLETEIGLFFFQSRWYDGQLGRFTSADTIIPEPGNPMAWDRYAYTRNNPLRFTDPTGHRPDETGCKVDGCYTEQDLKDIAYFEARQLREQYSFAENIRAVSPDGRKDSFVFAMGWGSNLHARNKNGMKIPTTLYWGISVVFDNMGGIQLYSETLDVQFNPDLELSPGEQANPSTLFGVGVSFTKGLVWKEAFITTDYQGGATSWGGSFDIFTVDYYKSFPNGDLEGIDAGFSFGSPSGWRISTHANPLTGRIDLTSWDE